MGDLQINITGVAEGLARFLGARGWVAAGQGASPFGRVFPNGAGLQALSGLGVIAPGSAGTPVDAPGGMAYGLGLDPDYSGPHVIVGVHFGDFSSMVLLRPGDWHSVPSGWRRAYVYNAGESLMRSLLATTIVLSNGPVALLASRILGARPDWNNTRIPRGALGVQPFGEQLNNTGGPSESTIAMGTGTVHAWCPGGAKGVRINVYPTNTGATVDPCPADFAATVRPWILSRANFAGGLPNNALPANDTPDAAATNSAGTKTGAWVPAGENDLICTQANRSFDRAIAAGTIALAFQVPTLPTGTGVNGVYVALEFY